MADPKWTPEPWEYHPGDGIITANDGHTLIGATAASIIGDAPEDDPNGWLMASAPAMYDALAFVEHSLDSLAETWGAEGMTRTVADRVRAAMAIARGEG